MQSGDYRGPAISIMEMKIEAGIALDMAARDVTEGGPGKVRFIGNGNGWASPICGQAAEAIDMLGKARRYGGFPL